MAFAVPPSSWENGFREPSSGTPWAQSCDELAEIADDPDAYVPPPSKEIVTSPAHNEHGINVIRTWPTLYDGTNNPHGVPSWWKPANEVDVLIVGAGPSGLEAAASLARQGVSFRIIDKADGPLAAGRADGVQPRFLETVSMWGLAPEIHEEGPLIERTAIYKDGKKLIFNRSHQSDSRYRGLHIITQGQIERIFIRDLARHRTIVERSSVLAGYRIQPGQHGGNEHPISATIVNGSTGLQQEIRAKYIIGADGASSSIRKSLNIPFDGVSTDIYWGIMDCIFETDYPHAWVFGLYTQLDISHTGSIAALRQAQDPSFAESGGKVDVHSITPDEILQQANRIFAPYKLKFGAPLSWFAIWKISERVARSYSSPDQRVHLVGDAAHVHSVMGAFGLNASILDAANLAWKVGLAAKGLAEAETLLATYGEERRKHAIRIIQVSGTYLRFICGSELKVPDFTHLSKPEQVQPNTVLNGHSNGEATVDESESIGKDAKPKVNGVAEEEKSQREKDLEFLGGFFKSHGQFLLGVDCGYDESILAPPTPDWAKQPPALRVRNGVRAPNPRVCLGMDGSGYLYDKLQGPPRFHLVVFASSAAGREVRRQLGVLADTLRSPTGLFHRFGGAQLFNLVLVVKLLPFEYEERLANQPELQSLQKLGAQVVFDDRAPDEDAHTTWGVTHRTGALAVIRPDLWLGMSAPPEAVDGVSEYFEGFLRPI
ncbi:hypothetical protein DL768_011346 [Monosporascus sp. mg162]|nr:hypothetical protein DL768_011346 [Monosporascus sp. mg162]